KLVAKFLRDTAGSVLVQYTLVFPLFLMVVMGTVDATYMFYEWVLANKAAYTGARIAIVSNPVPQNITAPSYTEAQLQQLGQNCFNATTGAANGNCPSISTVCTGATGSGSCTNGFTWDDAAFTAIFTRMQQTFPRLERANVQISYQTNNLGFVGQ